MKFLAIEKEVTGADWAGSEEILRSEALHVRHLIDEGVIKEIYFNEEHSAVIIMECEDKEHAKTALARLPLVIASLIDFDVMELRRYTGFDRLK